MKGVFVVLWRTVLLMALVVIIVALVRVTLQMMGLI